MTAPSSGDNPNVEGERPAEGEDRPAHASELFPLVYEELRKLAHAKMAHLPQGHTLQPTALVNEVFIRLSASPNPVFKNRGHIFAAAARSMRNILVDWARTKGAVKRGGDRKRVSLDDALSHTENAAEQILGLDRLLDKLNEHNPRQGSIVLLRYFAGLTNEQIAESLGMSTRTVEREWHDAKAWLKAKWEGDGGGGSAGAAR
jgi:RNA polymerase sigma factor (TIGR02999 family)